MLRAAVHAPQCTLAHARPRTQDHSHSLPGLPRSLTQSQSSSRSPKTRTMAETAMYASSPGRQTEAGKYKKIQPRVLNTILIKEIK